MTLRHVEKPPHVMEGYVRDIGDEDLLRAVRAISPWLVQARNLADKGETQEALKSLAAHLASRTVPLWYDPRAWWEHLPAQEREEILARARETPWDAVRFDVDREGRSAFYGKHYLAWGHVGALVYAAWHTGDMRYAETFFALLHRWDAQHRRLVGGWPGLDPAWYTLAVTSRVETLLAAEHLLRDLPIPGPERLYLFRLLLGSARWLLWEHDDLRPGNWQAVGAAALALVGLAFPELAEAEEFLAHGERLLLGHLREDVGGDGGHRERSPGYHRMVLHALERVVRQAEAVGRTLAVGPADLVPLYRWCVSLSTPLGHVPPFGDSGPVDAGELAARGACLTGDPVLAWVAEKFSWGPDAVDRLGWPARGWPSPVPPAAGLRVLPDSGYVVLRQGWGEEDAVAVLSYGPEGPHELETHSHLDPLHFTFAARGRELLVDRGGPAGYDDLLYHAWYRATWAHNTLVVNGHDAAGPEKAGRLLVEADHPFLQVAAAAHDGYWRSDGVRHRRLLLLRPDGSLLVHDLWEQAGPTHVQWFAHGALDPAQPLPEAEAVRFGTGPCLLVQVLSSPGPVSLAVGEGPGLVSGREGRSLVVRRQMLPWGAFRLVTPAGGHGHLTVLVVPETAPGALRSRRRVMHQEGETLWLEDGEVEEVWSWTAGPPGRLRAAGTWSVDGLAAWVQRSPGCLRAWLWRGTVVAHRGTPVFTCRGWEEIGVQIEGTALTVKGRARAGASVSAGRDLRPLTPGWEVTPDGARCTAGGIVQGTFEVTDHG